MSTQKEEEQMKIIEANDDNENAEEIEGDDNEGEEEEEEEEGDEDQQPDTTTNNNDPKTLNKKRKKRKNRNGLQGKQFSCRCGKMYLSNTALKSHQRKKHKAKIKEGTEEERKRGRPKKYVYTDEYPKEQVFFFDAKNRKPSARNPVIVQTSINAVASFMDQVNKNHNGNLLSLLREYKAISKPLEERKTDDVIYEYLLQTKHLTNQRYYDFMLKILLLLREHYNKTKEDDSYSMNNSIEELPLISNSFLDDYLVSNNYFGICFADQAEIAEIILNFSLWIHENGYSSYLISKNNNKPQVDI